MDPTKLTLQSVNNIWTNDVPGQGSNGAVLSSPVIPHGSLWMVRRQTIYIPSTAETTFGAFVPLEVKVFYDTKPGLEVEDYYGVDGMVIHAEDTIGANKGIVGVYGSEYPNHVPIEADHMFTMEITSRNLPFSEYAQQVSIWAILYDLYNVQEF